MSRRVVVTGLGVLTSIGIGKNQFWEGLRAGKSGIRRCDDEIDLSGTDVLVGSPVLDFDPVEFMDKKRARRMGRASQFGLAVASLVIEDSDINLKKQDLEKMGAIMGTGIGNMETLLVNHQRLLKRGARRVSPLFGPKMMPNAIAGQIGIQWGLKGPNFGLVSACASGNHAIGQAADLIYNGYAEVMIAGGSESVLLPLTFAAFDRMGALSKSTDPQKASRPFDKERDGFVMGEGAGAVLLEELEAAKRRGAHIYAELAGFGLTADAQHITAPAEGGEGAKRAMEMALSRAKVDKTEIDYINAHGTSTPLNDKTETQAIKSVFGKRAYQIPISSTKSQIGHLLGAAGGTEACATLLAMENSLIPPTINYRNPDPECDLDYVPNTARKAEIKVALSNSFGFGGQNSTLILKKL